MSLAKSRALVIFGALVLLAAASRTDAAPFFLDDFTTGPQPEWSVVRGSWSTPGGAYGVSSVPGGGAHALLPFDLFDFDLEVDVNDVDDGGIWLRSGPASSSLGVQGILLVTAGAGTGPPEVGTGGLYWHAVPDVAVFRGDPQ